MSYDSEQEIYFQGCINQMVAALRLWSEKNRKKFLDTLGEDVCLLCGDDVPCYCNPCYDI